MASAKHKRTPAQINRRSFLSLAPAAIAVSALPVMALPVETPIGAPYREWTAIHAQLRSADHGLSDDEWEARHEETWTICNRIMALPSECPSDVMAKIMVFTCEGDHELPKKDDEPEFWAEARALVAS